MHQNHPPGEGRGSVGKVAVTKDRAQLATFPNWAPASAGVVRWTVNQLYPSARYRGSMRLIPPR
jgi:hypothetical protein